MSRNSLVALRTCTAVNSVSMIAPIKTALRIWKNYFEIVKQSYDLVYDQMADHFLDHYL